MQFKIVINTTDAPDVNTAGLTSTVVYVLTEQLKNLPGVMSVQINEIQTIEEDVIKDVTE